MRAPASPTPFARDAQFTASRRSRIPLGNLVWLDALKGIAIVAVVLDHAFIVDDYLVWKHLYFAVSWFIFLAGVSNTYSARQRDFRPLVDAPGFWRRRSVSLLVPYAVTSMLAFVALYLGRTSLHSFLKQFILFHTLPPLYFIALLLQLLLLFPLIFALLYRWGWPGRIAVAVAIIPVAAVLSQKITFPWVLGAHYLFGASFLYLFVLGMVAEPWLSSERIGPGLWLICSLPLFAWAERENIATNGLLMTHPPSNLLVAYSVGLLGICYALCRRFASSFPVRLAARLGHGSLDIFLFHYLFVLPILQYRQALWTQRLPLVEGQALLIAVAVPTAIAGSLLLGRIRSGLTGAAGRGAGRAVSALGWAPAFTGRGNSPDGRPRWRGRRPAPATQGR